MFYIIWFLLIIASLLLLRKAVQISNGDAFGDFEIFGLIGSIFLCLIPVVNIIYSLIFLCTKAYINTSFDAEEIARKVFRIKDNNK